MLRGIADRLALTNAERRAIVFLTGTFMLGLLIRLLQGTFASPPIFDYSASDSVFAALSVGTDSLETSAQRANELRTENRTESSHTRGDRRVNINSATKDDLMSLPGIGSAMADRIILERIDGGPFRSAADLKRVRGLGPKRIEQLRPLVTVD